jgi:hypothetical protein
MDAGHNAITPSSQQLSLDDYNTDNNPHDNKNGVTGLMVDSSFVIITKNKRNSNIQTLQSTIAVWLQQRITIR